jgi:hypothetical protein
MGQAKTPITKENKFELWGSLQLINMIQKRNYEVFLFTSTNDITKKKVRPRGDEA